MKRKPIPPPTAQNVLPPNLDRDYFDDALDNPFRPRAQTFEPVNAWWLAEAALLAYADEGFARRQFGRASLGDVGFVSKAGSQCYLAESRDFVMVVFRGTQVPKPGATTDPVRGLEETVRDFIDVEFFEREIAIINYELATNFPRKCWGPTDVAISLADAVRCVPFLSI